MRKFLSLLVVLLTTFTSAWADTKEYVNLGLPSGLLWATCNVGATNPYDYGLYFAWGETAGHSGEISSGTTCKDGYSYNWANAPYQTNSSASSYNDTKWSKYLGSTESSYKANGTSNENALKTTLDATDDAATVKWGSSWKMPTNDDFLELASCCFLEWTDNYNSTGVKGVIVYKNKNTTGDGDKSYFKSGNTWKKLSGTSYGTGSQPEGYVAYTTSDTHIFLPAAGYRNVAILTNAGSHSNYWSSSLNTSHPSFSLSLYFSSGDVYLQYHDYRDYGRSVRPVMDAPVCKIGNTEYSSIQNAIAAVTTGQTIQLTADINLTAELSVASGKNFTLDLNGHVLKQTAQASVISNNGTLTIADNSAAKTGKITGGNTTQRGGGIYNTGTLNITGGTITGNSAVISGGGIENYNNGTVTVGGTAVVEGNTLTGTTTKSDLALNGSRLNISSTTPLATGAKIGISASTAGQFTNTAIETDAQYFFADDAAYYKHYNTTGTYLELKAATLSETATDATVISEIGSQTVNPTVTRTFNTGHWNSLCMPFSMTADEISTAKLGTVMQMTNIANNVVNFTTASTINAGEMYIVQPTEAVTSFTVIGKTLSTPEAKSIDGWTVTSPMYGGVTVPQGSYVLSNDNFYYVDSNVTMNGFRWYIQYNGGSQAKSSLGISFDGETTGLTTADIDALAPTEGKYLENGRILIMKNNKKYNVNGQEVK